MKKNYIIGVIACAALTMTSCSNDEIGGNNTKQGDPIEFGVYLGRDAQDSRGTIITTDNLKKFGVSAYLEMADIPDFMYNQEVIKSADGSWTYSPVKYWPTMKTEGYKAHFISFYAYAPHTNDANNLITLSGNNDEHAAPTVTISLPTGTNADLAKMVDFVATAKHFEYKTNGNGVSDKVTFNLKHEMTRIDLKAQVSENVYGSTPANKTKVVIRSLKLKSGGEFYTKANYRFPQTNQAERGTWDNRTKATTDIDLQSILNWSSDWTISSKDIISSTNQGIALEGTSAVNLFNENQYLFLIPSNKLDNEGKPAGLEANTTSTTITYDIITEDGNLENGYSKTSATKTVYLPAGIMQQGKAYNLTFTIAVDQVKLDATVAGWDTDTDSGIDVPYTPDDATPKP